MGSLLRSPTGYFSLPVKRVIITEISDTLVLDAVSVVVIRMSKIVLRIKIHVAVLGLVVPEVVIAWC